MFFKKKKNYTHVETQFENPNTLLTESQFLKS